MRILFTFFVVILFIQCTTLKNKDVFKISTTISFNNENIVNKAFIVIDSIIIEPIYIKKNFYKQNINSLKTESNRVHIREKDSLDGYYLLDVDGINIYRFGKDYNFQEKITLDKKTGFKNFDEISEIYPYLSKFQLKNNILEYTTEDSTKYTIHIDKALYNRINFHPISKFLDKKFEGICTSLTMTNSNFKTSISYDIVPINKSEYLEIHNIFNNHFKLIQKSYDYKN